MAAAGHPPNFTLVDLAPMGESFLADVLAGLGASTERPTVRVTWPDGSTDEWRNVSVDGWTTLTQGGGR